MPAAYTTAIAGGGRELEETLVEFFWAFLVAVLLLYIVLAPLFKALFIRSPSCSLCP